MKKMFLLFSHKLTEIQREDAIKGLNIETFVSLPEKLQNYWSNVDPINYDNEKFQEIMNYVKQESNAGDYALIQGEWGFVYNAVNICKEIEIVPLYSTTEREVKEIHNSDGSVEKISIFKHIIYKKY